VNLWTVGCADPRKLHSTPQQDRMNLISGKGETSSRLPAFSLFLPGTCPNSRDRRTCSSQPRRSGSADGSIADSCRSRFLRAWAFASWRPREVRDSAIRSGSTVCSRQAVRPILSDHGCGGRRAFFTNPARADGTSAASHIRRGASRRHRSCQRRRARLYQGGLQLHLRHLRPLSWRHRCNASDVGDAGASHRYRLLRPLFPPRCLWIDPCGPHMVRAVPPTAS
jgi:hypothetical protein